uniref:Uncharacterized protein n=1 Tax=Plectus sambesii TaxID=2011161 RepID=A0A914VFF8_9BILA
MHGYRRRVSTRGLPRPAAAATEKIAQAESATEHDYERWTISVARGGPAFPAADSVPPRRSLTAALTHHHDARQHATRITYDRFLLLNSFLSLSLPPRRRLPPPNRYLLSFTPAHALSLRDIGTQPYIIGAFMKGTVNKAGINYIHTPTFQYFLTRRQKKGKLLTVDVSFASLNRRERR